MGLFVFRGNLIYAHFVYMIIEKQIINKLYNDQIMLEESKICMCVIIYDMTYSKERIFVVIGCNSCGRISLQSLKFSKFNFTGSTTSGTSGVEF